MNPNATLPSRRIRRAPALLTVVAFALPFVLSACFIVDVIQPDTADAGSTITVTVNVGENIPDQNAHTPVLSVMVPDDWALVSAAYTSEVGDGVLEFDEGWSDSTEALRPADPGMKWIGMLADQAYAYPDASDSDPVTGTATVQLRVGQTLGDFDLGYLITDDAFSVQDLAGLFEAGAGDSLLGQTITVQPGIATEDEPGEGVSFTLEQPAPNPSRGATTLRYTLSQVAEVNLAVYDAAGRRVAVLREGRRGAGAYEARLDTRGLPSGSYLCRMEADGRLVGTRTLVLAR